MRMQSTCWFDHRSSLQRNAPVMPCFVPVRRPRRRAGSSEDLLRDSDQPAARERRPNAWRRSATTAQTLIHGFEALEVTLWTPVGAGFPARSPTKPTAEFRVVPKPRDFFAQIPWIARLEKQAVDAV